MTDQQEKKNQGKVGKPKKKRIYVGRSMAVSGIWVSARES